jgi:transposase
MRPHGSQAELEHRRKLAVQRLLDGHTPTEIASILGVDTSSVRRWVHEYRERGFDALTARHVGGRPRKLTATQEKIVLRWLNEMSMNLGFPTELWTGPRVAHLIEREFGVRLHPHYIVEWLRASDMTPQIPLREPFERDPEAIATWTAKRWPAIQRKAAKSGASVAFIDESEVLMAPLVRRTWAPRGHQPHLRQIGRGEHEKVSIAAAIWYRPSSGRLALFFKTLVNEYFDSFYSACFLEAMAKSIPRPIIVIWDGGNMHKGDSIRSLNDKLGDNLILERLPPYAPMLNPVELL